MNDSEIYRQSELQTRALRRGWMIMKDLIFFVFAAALTGCQTQAPTPNGFAMFYQDEAQNLRPEVRARLLPPSGPPQIENVPLAQIQDETKRFLERGFVRIGVASFSGPAGTRKQVIEQAVKVGAEIVIIGSEFSHAMQGVRPSLSLQPGQTYTTQERGTMTANTLQGGNNAFAYGSYAGSATTTTSPTVQTQYTPYQIPIFSQVASFWRRAKPGIFGASFAPIPEEMRAKLERNTGVSVVAIVEGSPAFKANIIRGDVIIKVANKPVDTVQELMDALLSYAGQKVSLTIIRDTKTLTLEVQLNEAPETP
jgi:hypothetical protein